jgi:hypothetical protein
MSREVSSVDTLKSATAGVSSVVAMTSLLLTFAACSGSSASPGTGTDVPTIEYINGEPLLDAGMVGDADAAVATPVDCSLVRATASSSSGCRGDWSCPGIGVYSFTCGTTDGGGAECYCRLNRDLQKSGLTDGCGEDINELATVARQFCDWTFLPQTNDGGGAQ